MAVDWSKIDSSLRAIVEDDYDFSVMVLQIEVWSALIEVPNSRMSKLTRDELIYTVCLIRKQRNVVEFTEQSSFQRLTDKSEF